MARIGAFWEQSETLPFEWGQSDCVTWACSYVEAVTGFDPAQKWRGTYNTKWGARKIIMQNGGLQNLLSHNLSMFPEGETQDGIAFIVGNKTTAMSVLVDGRAWVKNETGLCIFHKPEIIKGWTLCHKQSL